MDDDPCLISTQSGVATLTLNRPDTRNALSEELMTSLKNGLATSISDPQVRVIVITSTGNTFCSGANLKEPPGASQSTGPKPPPQLVEIIGLIRSCGKPVIARVQGHVAAGGNGLVAACDFAFAADTAKFAFTEVRVGVAPAIISVVCLPRLRLKDALDLFLTGKRITADQAVEVGLLSAVASEEGLDAMVQSCVDELKAGAPEAIAATKDLIYRVPSMSTKDAFEWTTALSLERFASDEAREGIAAFLEKRKPSWNAREDDTNP